MGAINAVTIADATLTDAGTVTQAITGDFTTTFEGVINFAVTATQVSGTTAGNIQVQGSLDNTNFVDVGGTVAIADGTTVLAGLPSTTISYNYYRITITGSGTQSTTISTTYSAKYKEV